MTDWVRVSDRAPGIHEDVLGYWCDWGSEEWRIDRLYRAVQDAGPGIHTYWVRGRQTSRVTHWMPLPPLPDAESKAEAGWRWVQCEACGQWYWLEPLP
jgi:hypothetical protein